MITHRFFSSDRTQLCADVYEPEGPSAGFILLVHGYCEHRGRYRTTASDLARAGYRVATVDLRGHGESGGARAHVLRFDEYLEDVDAALASCAAGEKPILLGHSMGGLVSLRYALERPGALRALALSSPFVGLAAPVPEWKKLLGRVASRLYPGLTLPNEIRPEELSSDLAVGRAYMADPLVPKVATARWFTEAMAAQELVRRRAGELRLPVHLQHGAADHIADPRASEAVFQRLGSDDKQLKLYPGLRHEIFNEVERDRVIAELVTWLKAH